MYEGTDLKTFAKLGLLLVYDTKAEINLVGLLEIRLHAHDLSEGFLGMLQRAVTVVQDTDAIPEFWFLRKGLSAERLRR